LEARAALAAIDPESQILPSEADALPTAGKTPLKMTS
jgi:hypothetical protein